MQTDKQNTQAITYHERVLPSIGSFLPVLLVAPTLWLMLLPIAPMVGIFSGLVISVIICIFMIVNSPLIEIREGLLLVNKANISLDVIGDAVTIDKKSAFAERGPNLDSRAFLAIQASAPTMVKIRIIDPADPTPYLLVSSRHPDELISALAK
jgi:hypothetical protein